MKTLHYSIIAVFLGFTGLMLSYDNSAYGMWVPQSPRELLDESSTIFVGNITSVNVLQFEKGITYNMEENGIEKNTVKNYTLSLDEYKVDVEEFLKNTQMTNKMTVRQPAISLSPGMLGGLDEFHAGDRVLFYVKSLDGNNIYSPESFIIPKSCVAKDVLTQKRLEARGESFTIQNGIKVDSNFTANKPIQFVDNEDVNTLSGKNLDILVHITKNTGSSPEIVFNKEFYSKAKPCEWIASTEWEFTPQEGEYRMDVTITEDNKTYSQYVAKFSAKSDMVTPDHMSPLKQFKSGIVANDVKCGQGLQLVIKAEDGFPACVKPDTAKKLLERGWVPKISSSNSYAAPTKILSQVFPTNAALSAGEPSVKGYLTSTDGTALSNKQINIIIDNATFENGTSIENILVGKTSTDQNGCFYFADWNQDAIDRFQKDMAEKTPHGAPTDLVSIKAVFTGDSKFQGSSNATKFTYYTIAVPIVRPALSAFLVNGSDIVLEQGKSYNFTDFSTWGEALQLHTISIEMKNLPCGIYEKTREVSVTNNQTQVIMPIELKVEKTAPVGNFTTYISVNNQALEPINLEIK